MFSLVDAPHQPQTVWRTNALLIAGVRGSNLCHFPSKLERDGAEKKKRVSLCNSVETNVPGGPTLTLKDLCQTARRRCGGST